VLRPPKASGADPAQGLDVHDEPEQIRSLAECADRAGQGIELGFARPALGEHRLPKRLLADLVLKDEWQELMAGTAGRGLGPGLGCSSSGSRGRKVNAG